jgi:hypothetical protein
MATTASTNSHSGKHRSDHEIEKYRLELNWTKIIDKLKTTKVSGFILFCFFYFKMKFIFFCKRICKIFGWRSSIRIIFTTISIN